MADHITDFRDAMAADGIKFRNAKDKVIADGKLHRFDVDGDAAGTKNGWYVLHVDDRPAGQFGCAKRFGIERKLTWTAKGATPLTREERAALDAKIAASKAEAEAAKAEKEAEAAVKAQAMWETASEAGHSYLTRKGIKGHGARVGVFVRALRPGADGEPREQRVPNTLLIPMRGPGSRTPLSLQAIYDEPLNVGGGDRRAKDFVYGGRKRGLWYAIGKPGLINGVETFAICEGFATGASIHEATGLAVIVAFDAGNLQPVAETLRELRPNAAILICADNDAWTTHHDGTPWNPGSEKALAAADAINGKAVRPVFANVDTKPTDFNDLQALEGADEVRRQVMAALAPEPPSAAPEPAPEHPETDGPPPSPPMGSAEDYGLQAGGDGGPTGELAEAVKEFTVNPDVTHTPLPTEGKFEVMGYEEDRIFIRIEKSGVILGEKPSYWKSNLSLLAHPDFWERINTPEKEVIPHLVQDAYAAGRFNLGMARGLGAWEDEGRHVFYLGETIIADGVQLPIRKFVTDHIYYSRDSFKFPGEAPMTAIEGREVLALIERLSWARNSSPILVAGWLALAPICGALKWRPHTWLCGPAGTGKTTAMNLVNFFLEGYALFSNGNSTEAGLRQTLLTSARPVIMDEGEQLSEKEAVAMQAIITLARQSSSGTAARTYKGGQDGNAQQFSVRSMFCFGSIQVGLHHQQDKQRISILHLKKTQSKTADADWDAIEAAIEEMEARPNISVRLIRRAIDLLPITLKNIPIFTAAAAKHFGSQRLGDQYGTLVAGAWSLVSNRMATPQEAASKIAAFDWTDYTEDATANESVSALDALASQKVFIKAGAEPTVRELVLAAMDEDTPGITIHQQDAIRQLGLLGIAIDARTLKEHGPKGAYLLIHRDNNDRATAMRKSGVSNLAQMLMRLDGVEKVPNAFRIEGRQKRGLAMPLVYLTEGYPEEGGAEVVPFVGADEPMGDMPMSDAPLDLDDNIEF